MEQIDANQNPSVCIYVQGNTLTSPTWSCASSKFSNNSQAIHVQASN